MSSLSALLKAKQQELKNRTGREKPVNPPQGSSRWRILPGWNPAQEELFFHDFGQHFVKDFSGDVKAVYVCTLRSFNKPCPICDVVASAGSIADPNAKTLVEDARAQQRHLLNAVRKNEKGVYEQDVSILSLPTSAFNALITVVQQYLDGDGINVFDPDSGYDVIITREGTGPKNTKYTVMVAPKSNPISKDYLAKRRNLDEYCDQEYEQGKTAALTALRGVAHAGTPSLATLPAPSRPTPVLGTAAVRVATPVAAPVASSDAEVEDALSIDLSDVDLDGLEAVE